MNATGPVSSAPPVRPGAGSTTISQRCRPAPVEGGDAVLERERASADLDRRAAAGRERDPDLGRARRRDQPQPLGRGRAVRGDGHGRARVRGARARARATRRPGSGCGRRQAWLYAGSPRWSRRRSIGRPRAVAPTAVQSAPERTATVPAARLDEPVEQRDRAVAAELEQLEPELVLAGAQVLGQVVGLQAVHVALGVGVEAALAADLDAVDQHAARSVGADQHLGGRGLGGQRHARAERDDRALGDARRRPASTPGARSRRRSATNAKWARSAVDVLAGALRRRSSTDSPAASSTGAGGQVAAAVEGHRPAVEPGALGRGRADREERRERALDVDHGAQVDGLAGRDGPEVEELLRHASARPR